MLTLEQKKRLELFLQDDAGAGDATGSLIPEKQCVAEIVAEEDCVLAGVEESAFILELAGLQATALKKEGERAKRHDAVIRCRGSNRAVFLAERTSLNVLARMAGVATLCSKAAKIASDASGGKTRVAATRKTLPGFNVFDKKAAALGGAQPHRANLSDMVLFKTNELAYFKNPKDAIAAARKTHGFSKKVEVEVETIENAANAAQACPDIIMLDNMDLRNAGMAIAEIRKHSKCLIEISGGVTLENLAQYAALKPDVISMGMLTQNAPNTSFGMEIRK